VLDRPIAFNPAFKKITGSTVAALMLSQAWYWSKRTADEDGWFYKTLVEWEEETGLSRSEQETARKHLKGMMEVKLRGVPAQLYYRVNKPKIYELLGIQFAGMSQTSLQEPSKPVSEVPANINKNAETTTETTTQRIARMRSSFPKKGLSVDWQVAMGQPEITPDLRALAKQAIEQHFRIFPTWTEVRTKGRSFISDDFLDFVEAEGITPEQIERAAKVWFSDKRFAGLATYLITIHHHWPQLMEARLPEDDENDLRSKITYS
jgi:hypothetical protein